MVSSCSADGDDAPHRGGGQLVAGEEARAVMVGNGLRHLRALPRRRGVVGAHDALDARELHDGVGDEVGLRQQRGAARVGGVGLGQLRVGGQVGREGRDAVGLGAHGAQALLEDHLVQALDVGLEGMLQVLLVEELRVGEPGAHDALVAVDDGGCVRGVAVADEDEPVRQVALGVVEREVALVHEHGVDDDLLGNLEELLVEGAHQRRRVLREVRDLEQRLGGKLRPIAGLLLDGSHPLADDLLAFALARHDEGGAHRGHERVGVGHLPGARGEEAVAPGEPSRLQPGEAHGDDLVAEQGHQPADGAREQGGLRPPAARLRPRDGLDDALEHLGEHGRDVRGGHTPRGEDVLGAVLLAPLEVLGGHALAAGEAEGRLGGRARLVEGDLRGGAAEGLDELVGAQGHVLHDDDEPPRRREHGRVLVGDALGVQGGGDGGRQLLGGAVQVERGDLRCLSRAQGCASGRCCYSRPSSSLSEPSPSPAGDSPTTFSM